MQALVCDLCGGGLVMDVSGEFATCEYCGTKYMTDRLQAKIQEIRGKVQVEGAVETIKGKAEFDRLLNIFQTNIKLNDAQKASETLDKLIDDFPDDYRTWCAAIKLVFARRDYPAYMDPMSHIGYSNSMSMISINGRIAEYIEKCSILNIPIEELRATFDQIRDIYNAANSNAM